MKAILLSFLFFTVTGLSFVVVSYSGADPIGRAAIGTQFRLLGYKAFLCSNDCITKWITGNHGEAPNHQVMIVFAAFGIANPGEFKKIVNSLPIESKSSVLERISFAITDSGMEGEFTKAFSFGAKNLLEKF